jgi:RNA polymerase sigma factor (sigma-70 family)
MVQATRPSVVRQIESLFDGGSVAGLTDRQLIERFVARRDPAGEAAFAALVTRHGPMVLGVCRQLLGDRHLAEDTVQATFMVLARKARSIGEPELLGNWLYGVALRTARKARGRLAQQREYEAGADVDGSRSVSALNAAIESAVVAAEHRAVAREECEALHDEVERLPSNFRLPIVLCYFEGLTLDEAAQTLRWRAGTLRSRLAPGAR